MKKILLFAAALLATTSIVASAADLPVKAAPYVVPVANWTGWYVGIQGGGSDGTANHTVIIDGIGFLNAPYGPTKISGGNIGGVIGYDWQFASNWVVGINTEFNGGKIKGTFDNGIPLGWSPGGDDIYQSEVTWFGSTRAKLGFVLPTYSSLMIYGNAGVAYARIKAAEGDGLNGVTALNCNNDCAFGSKTQVGYTVGAGVSWLIPSTRLVLSGEYGFYNFGTAHMNTVDVFGIPMSST